MTMKKTLTALTIVTLTTTLAASAALADRGMGMGGMRGEGHGMMAEFDFAAIDTDKDGKITQAEIDAWRAADIKAADTDGDGFLSADELTAMHVKRVTAQATAMTTEMMTRMDADKDGKLSAAEMAVRPAPAGLFDRLDTDKDGALSQAELDAAKSRMAHGQDDHRGGKGKGERRGMFGHGHDNN